MTHEEGFGAAAAAVEHEDDEQSIIDVFDFDDSNQDQWLCSAGPSKKSNSETKIEDLNAWLHADGETDAEKNESGSKRLVDSRTFTRIKRRTNNRLSFENGEANESPDSMPFTLSNIWRNQAIPESQIINKDNRDSIPLMLRPKTNQVLSAFLSESPASIGSEASMEAFLNAAKSKESLLSDVSEPDINHFLMNISQPSLLYSSIMSDTKVEESQIMIKAGSLIDSQILTDSMMDASMFKEVQDTTLLADFLKQNSDQTVLEEQTFCKSSNEHSFISDKTYVSSNDTYRTCVTNSDNSKSSNDTYIAYASPTGTLDSTQNISPTDYLKSSTGTLNSTKTISSYEKDDVLCRTQTLSNDNTFVKFDLNLNSKSPNYENSDGICQTSNFSATLASHTVPGLRSELLKEVSRSNNKFERTFELQKQNIAFENNSTKLNNTFNANATFGANKSQSKLNETFKANQSPSKLATTFKADKSPAQFNSTYKKSPPKFTNTTFNAIEREDVNLEVECNLDVKKNELLDKTYIQQSDIQKNLDVTFNSARDSRARFDNALDTHLGLAPQEKNVSSETHQSTLEPSRFNTYRKNPKQSSVINNNRYTRANVENNYLNDRPSTAPAEIPVYNKVMNQALNQNRFNTFSKKSGQTKISEINTDCNKSAKPVGHIQPPRQLSKLPQLFQKSHPNLGSTLTMKSKEIAIGFNDGKCTLGRFKSEQKLRKAEFIMTNNGNSKSMESISSGSSVPDYEDKLSTCSDNSKASYIVLSTPKVKGVPNVLENTWAEEHNLPSPILKNGSINSENCGRSISPTEYAAKTSSPLFSPSGSDQALQKTGIDNCGFEAAKENLQNVKPTQMKLPISNTMRLKKPMNYGTSNKVASGIPRPASRIPAPKSSRPHVK